MQEWHSDALFNKAKSYIELAFEADRGSYPFPLLAAVALELLGKSAELCGKVGDGVSQAADFISAASSIPSLNFTPSMTFGNWF